MHSSRRTHHRGRSHCSGLGAGGERDGGRGRRVQRTQLAGGARRPQPPHRVAGGARLAPRPAPAPAAPPPRPPALGLRLRVRVHVRQARRRAPRARAGAGAGADAGRRVNTKYCL